jgi:hypothetical protein
MRCLIKNVEAAQVSSRLSQTLKLTVCGVFAGKKVCRRSESFFFLKSALDLHFLQQACTVNAGLVKCFRKLTRDFNTGFLSTGDQGCQMVCFQTQNPNLGKFWRVLQWKILVNFMTIWSILRPLEIFYCHLVYCVVIWYIFPRFGILYEEKSGNPAGDDRCQCCEAAGFS